MKILYFVDNLECGGIQSFLYNYISNMDLVTNEVSLLVLDDGQQYELEDKFKKLGIIFYKLKDIWIRTPFDYIKYEKAVDQFFKNHHAFDIIHLHASSKNYYILKCAKKYNIPVRIAHSHNTGFQTHNKIKIFVGNSMKKNLNKNATHYLACSELAGNWLFGNSKDVRIIRNAVDLDQYKFDMKKRLEFRKQLGIGDELAVCNVGRLEKQKNHEFLLEIFYEVLEIEPSAKLFLIGTGSLKNELTKKVELMKLEKNVVFLGFRKDVADLLQAMDIFLMPSLHEGFPVTAVEAQAEGLPCIFSSTITPEVKLLPETCFLDLDTNPKVWANKIIEIFKSYKRTDKKDILTSLGFNLKLETAKLMDFYKGEIKKNDKK